MAHRKSLEALDRTLKDIRQDRRPFGGMTLVLAGDFRQTLPVIPRGTPADELEACLKNSPLWRLTTTLKLRTNIRVRNGGGSEDFARLLLTIGNGTYPMDPRTSLIRLLGSVCNLVETETNKVSSPTVRLLSVRL